jgi:polyisoprenoid-binding protein YceI
MKSTFARLSLIALTTVAVTALNAQPAGPPPAGGPPPGGPPPSFTAEAPIKVLNQVPSGDYRLDPEHGRVIWSLSHHGYSKLAAMLPRNEGSLHLDTKNIANSKLDVTLHMDQVLTGEGPEHFDKLLKSESIFDTAKYPTAQFKSTRVEQVAPNKLKIRGDLTFHGVTKPLVIDGIFNQAGEVPGSYIVGFDGTATLKRSEYGVSFLLPSVGDEVQLTIEAEFMKPGKMAVPAFPGGPPAP